MGIGFSNIADIAAKLQKFWAGDQALGNVLTFQGEGVSPLGAPAGAGAGITILDLDATPVTSVNNVVDTTLWSFTLPTRAYVDPASRRLILYVYDLAAAPAGKSYQLWVIADGQATSAGVLELGPEGAARHDTIAQSTLSGGVTIAVTLEPEGGREQPSGPIVLAAK